MAGCGDLFNGDQRLERSTKLPRGRRMRGLLLKSDKCLALAAWERSKAQLDKQVASI